MMIIIKLFIAKNQKKTVLLTPKLKLLLSLHQNSIFYQEITLKNNGQKKVWSILMTPIANT